ncbi:MAG: hypothetical protein AB1556_05135 [Bacillota bacterium]
MIMDFFNWSAYLAKNNPVAYGVTVMLTMAGLGVAIALAVDGIFRLFGIHLGYYKKEFEDELSRKS